MYAIEKLTQLPQEFVRGANQVVVTSPHSSALQTALIACKSDGDCPIIVHPDLKHIKKDLTLGGLYPEGKPKFQGVTVSALEKALQRQPYRDTAARVDLSNLEEVQLNDCMLGCSNHTVCAFFKNTAGGYDA